MSTKGTWLEIGPATEADRESRLDAWLARTHPAISRSRWQELIRQGHVTVNRVAVKPNRPVSSGDLVRAFIPEPENTSLHAESIALDILYEDPDLVVINKPAGLVVHPAPGHESGTLVNALLHHCRDLAGIGGEKRPGIVHRLDKDTSGVLVVAKNEQTMNALSAQFKARSTTKEYAAVVWGTPRPSAATIRMPIGRDPVHRKKMSVRSAHGRDAVSHYKVLKQLGPASLLAVKIDTGRTHQIRVHLAHIRHPVVGDLLYGRKRPESLDMPVSRQMLHAWKLSFVHPASGLRVSFEAPWPDDFKRLTGSGAT